MQQKWLWSGRRNSIQAIEYTVFISANRFRLAVVRYPKGSGQEVVSARGNAIVAARQGRSFALRRTAIHGDFQSAAERFKTAQRSGFRDVHAAKGSNRA
jgi:hypothetical protein